MIGMSKQPQFLLSAYFYALDLQVGKCTLIILALQVLSA